MNNCDASLDEVQTFIFMDFETTGLINDHHCDPLLKRWEAGDKKRNTHSMLKNFVHFSDDPVLFIKSVHAMHAKQLQREAQEQRNKYEEIEVQLDLLMCV
uniref:Exonuclease domain-containing protein n=1 Tax=Ditylenchus dipsaci TaxID=166011 RepID=A0A915D3J1_9BILA